MGCLVLAESSLNSKMLPKMHQAHSTYAHDEKQANRNFRGISVLLKLSDQLSYARDWFLLEYQM